MRLTSISPHRFGKKVSPLGLKPVPLLVVYGPNETGKTTYVDLAIALLSNSRDGHLLARHGSVEDRLAGYIEFEHEEVIHRIAFSESARVMRSYRGNTGWREFSPKNSAAEETLAAFDDGIVRNLFRVDAVEIVASALLPRFSDEWGTSTTEIDKGVGPTKQRFISYASGGGGAALDFVKLTREMRDSADRILSEQNDVNGIAPLKRRRSELSDLLSAAERTQARYQDEKSNLAGLQDDFDKTRRDIADLASRERAMSFVHGFTAIDAAARAARRELDDLSTSSQLLPLAFASLIDVLQSKVSELRDLPLESELADLSKRVEELEIEQAKSAAALNALGVTSEDEFRDAGWLVDSERMSRITAINQKIAERDQLTQSVPQTRLVELNGVSAGLEQALKGAQESWDRTGMGSTPEQYVALLASGKVVVPEATRPERRMIYPLIGGGMASAVAAVPLGATWQGGLVGLVAVALVTLGVRELLNQREPKARGETSASTSDSRDLFGIANDVLTAQKKLDEHRSSLSSVESQRQYALSRASEIDADLGDLLTTWGLPRVAGLTLAAATNLSERLREAALAFLACDSLRERIKNKKDDVRNFQTGLERSADDITRQLKRVGCPVDLSILTSPKQLADRLQTLTAEFERQAGLRNTIDNQEDQLKQLSGEERTLVDEYLKLKPDERDALSTGLSNRKTELDNHSRQQQTKLSQAETEIRSLESASTGAAIRQQIATVESEIREQQLESALLMAQAKILEEASARRHKESMPLLVRQVESMVCKVASDWKALRLEHTEENYTIFVEYQDSSSVPDHHLSAGALTLLFTAMRLVIMQEEAKRSQGFSLPLFCDDPFIHLDDTRLEQAFQMLIEQAVGHQVLYFTCQSKVLDLATKLGIPTHEL